VSNIAVESSSVGSDQDFPILIAAKPITTGERNIALGAILILAIIDAMVIPYVSIRLPRVDPFIPVLQTVFCVIDLLTAALLFAQYSIQPLRCIIPVASGYVFSGLFAFIQTLAFPGAYAPTGVIGDGLNSAAWFFVLWHTTFPLALIVYVFVKGPGIEAHRSVGRAKNIDAGKRALERAGRAGKEPARGAARQAARGDISGLRPNSRQRRSLTRHNRERHWRRRQW
jgi:Membrane-associated sensor, integral membrane domain